MLSGWNSKLACRPEARQSEGWSAWRGSHLQPSRFERDASASWATRGCPPPDLHRHCARFKCAASALGYVGGMVPREGFAPSTSPV
jgi:hypothetical protein